MRGGDVWGVRWSVLDAEDRIASEACNDGEPFAFGFGLNR